MHGRLLLRASSRYGTPLYDGLTHTQAIAASGAGQRARVIARGLWLGPVAWLVALAGFGLLDHRATRTWGAVMIILAGALAGLAYRTVRFPSTFPTPGGLRLTGVSWKPRALSLCGLALALALTFAANASLAATPDSSFGLAGWLWLASMSLLVASCLGLRGPAAAANPSRSRDWPAWEVALFAGLVVMASLIRLWDLNHFPFLILGDERTTGRLAMDYYSGHPGPSVFALLWQGVDLSGLWFWTVARSLELGGASLWALRLPAALFGAATVIPFYGFVRLAWGRNAAIFGTAVLAFSAVDVGYSRVTLNNIVTPFFWSVCFFFLLRGLRLGRPVDWAAAGLAGGLSEYGYYGTRLLPFILLAFFGYLLLTHWRQTHCYLTRYLLVAVGYIVGFGPLIVHYARDPGLYTGRGASMLSWDRMPTTWEDLQRMWAALWPLIAGNFLGISNLGSQDAVYYGTLLLRPEAALLVMGIVVLIFHWRHPASFLVVLTAVSVLFVGGTLVNYGAVPFLSHWTPAFPAFYAALAVPGGAWLTQAQRSLPKRAGRFAPAVVAAGLIILGYLNVNYFFHDYYADPESLKIGYYRRAVVGLELQSAQAHYQEALGSRYAIRILGSAELLHNPNLPYLVRDQDYQAVEDPSQGLPVERAGGKGLAFIFMPGSEQQREPVRSLYRGGKDAEVRSRSGGHLFYTYVLPPAGEGP